MINERHNVVITEQYGDYSPPFPVKNLIEDLLSGISIHHLRGLQSIILRNSDDTNRRDRRRKTMARKQKVAIANCRGVYNQKWHDGPATIWIFVDNVIARRPKWLLRVPFFRHMLFSEVLFHELGHHIHYTTAPEYKEREDVAEEWKIKLTKEYAANRYGYLKRFRLLFRGLSAILRLVVFLIRKLSGRQNGQS